MDSISRVMAPVVSPIEWDSLPDELMIEVFKRLSWRDLGKVAQVSRRWKRLAADQHLWSPGFQFVKNILQNRFDKRDFSCRFERESCYRLFAQSMVLLERGLCCYASFARNEACVLALPFHPHKVQRISMHTALIRGADLVAILDTRIGKVVDVRESSTFCDLYDLLLLTEDRAAIHVELRSSNAILFSILKSGRRYVGSACGGEILACLLGNERCQVMEVYNWKEGRRLFTKESHAFTQVSVTNDGNVFFEEGQRGCGIYSPAQNRELLLPGQLHCHGDSLSASGERFFLRFMPDNHIWIHHLEQGEEMWHFQIAAKIISALLVGDRFIVYTEDHHLYIWELQKKTPALNGYRQLLNLPIELEAMADDCHALPNISRSVIALKTVHHIVLVDFTVGRVLRSFETQPHVSIYFDGEVLRQCTLSTSTSKLHVDSKTFL